MNKSNAPVSSSVNAGKPPKMQQNVSAAKRKGKNPLDEVNDGIDGVVNVRYPPAPSPGWNSRQKPIK